MNIRIIKFLKASFIDLAVDEDNETKLIGIPFDHGGAGYTRYYTLSEQDFKRFLADDAAASKLVAHGGQYIGNSPLYFSDFAPDNA